MTITCKWKPLCMELEPGQDLAIKVHVYLHDKVSCNFLGWHGLETPFRLLKFVIYRQGQLLQA